MEPDTEYVRVGVERVAFQVLGDGPPDLVMSAGTFGSIDLDWQDPHVSAMYRRMSGFCRLIRFDKRGSGASDPLPLRSLPPWESHVDDVLAVLDAVGSRRAAVMGMFDAGPVAALFAATHRDRTIALILANTAARLLEADDYPIGARLEVATDVAEHIEESWGTEEQARLQVPSRASDQHFARWFARYTRSIASPGAVGAYLKAMLSADARAVLASIHVPTLVLHRKDYALFRADHGRYLADHIEHASFVELPGADGPLAWEHSDVAVNAISRFLTGAGSHDEPDRALATVLFTDIVGSTALAEQLGDGAWRELLDRHDAVVQRVVSEFGGRVVDSAGDGMLASFTGPGRAVRAALALREELASRGLSIRSGLHTGEVEQRGELLGGIAVHIGARVMAAAEPGQILVSRTVRDITVGSSLRLTSQGVHVLKGVTGEWELFAVTD